MGHLATSNPQSCPYLGRVGASRSFQNGFHHKVPRGSSPGRKALSPPAQVVLTTPSSSPHLSFLFSPLPYMPKQSLHRKQVEGENIYRVRDQESDSIPILRVSFAFRLALACQAV